MTHSGAVERHCSNPQWGGYVSDLVARGLQLPRRRRGHGRPPSDHAGGVGGQQRAAGRGEHAV